jgi:hypothetical protein
LSQGGLFIARAYEDEETNGSGYRDIRISIGVPGTVLDIWYTLAIELDSDKRERENNKKGKKKKLTQNTRRSQMPITRFPIDPTTPPFPDHCPTHAV